MRVQAMPNAKRGLTLEKSKLPVTAMPILYKGRVSTRLMSPCTRSMRWCTVSMRPCMAILLMAKPSACGVPGPVRITGSITESPRVTLNCQMPLWSVGACTVARMVN